MIALGLSISAQRPGRLQRKCGRSHWLWGSVGLCGGGLSEIGASILWRAVLVCVGRCGDRTAAATVQDAPRLNARTLTEDANKGEKLSVL